MNSLEQLNLTSTFDLLDLLWRRRIIFALGTSIGLALGAVYYFQATRKYESTADVLVVSKRPEVVSADQAPASHFENYVATHRALIVSRLIIERAAEAADFRSLNTFSWLQPDEDLVEVVNWGLEVGAGARELGENADSIMTLSFRGTDPEECPVVVQAILDSYESFLDETYRGMSDDALDLIGQARDLLNNEIQHREEDYSQFRQESPLVTRGADEVNPLQDRLTAIEAKRSELLLRRAELEGELKSITTARESGLKHGQLVAFVSDSRNRSATVNAGRSSFTTLEDQLINLVDTKNRLLQYYGPNHPHVAGVSQRLAATREFLTLPTMSYLQGIESNPEQGGEPIAIGPVELRINYLNQELNGIRTSEELLDDLFTDAHEAAKELTSYELTDERYQRSIERTQQLYDGVISQLQDASLVKDYGGFDARVISRPLLGEEVSPDIKIVLPGSLFVGMLLGFCLAVGTEMSDKSFHSRDEIQSKLGLPVMGQIPQYAPASETQRRDDNAKFDPMLCTYFQRRSPQCEAYRTLRTNLFFRHSQDVPRLLQLTSPSAGDGTSIVAANLAISLAQLGRSVLLVDADLHNPRQQEIFGIDSARQLDCTLANQLVGEAVSKTAVDNLSLLTVHHLDSDCYEFFSSKRFPALLEAVRQDYDFVLIDSGPLMAASDPSVIATQVDGVLLNLKPSRDCRARAERAKKILDSLHVEPIGIIVNGVGGSSRIYREESSIQCRVYVNAPSGRNGGTLAS